jgi:hypothetical protein
LALHLGAEPLIAHAALLAPEPIPLFLFAEARERFGEPLASALEGDGLDEAVAALRAFALVDRETIADERNASITTHCIRLHRLVRQVAAERNTGETRAGRYRAVLEALAIVQAHAQDFRDSRMWPRARRLRGLIAAFQRDSVAAFQGDSHQESAALMLAIGSDLIEKYERSLGEGRDSRERRLEPLEHFHNCWNRASQGG